MAIDDRQGRLRFLIHDRDSKFGGGFDHVFKSEGIAVIRTPVQAPNANAHAERWVGSVRRECLDPWCTYSIFLQIPRILHATEFVHPTGVGGYACYIAICPPNWRYGISVGELPEAPLQRYDDVLHWDSTLGMRIR
jgi:hypothetical protein